MNLFCRNLWTVYKSLLALCLCATPALAHTGATGHFHAAAKRIENEAETVKGIKAEGRIGDYLLTNGLVSAVVEDLRYSSGIYKMGGLLADFGYLMQDGSIGHNRMDEMVPIVYPKDRIYTNLRVFLAKNIRIIADGSDGGPAVLRVEGSDGVLPYIKEVMKTNPGPVRVDWTIDYILRPGATVLEIRNKVKNPGAAAKNLHFGYIYFLGDGLKFFVPGKGYGTEAIKADFSKFIGLESPDVSYGLHYPDNPLKVLIDGGAIKGGSGDVVTMTPGEEKTFTTYVSIGMGDIASVYDPFLGPNESGTLIGKVQLTPQARLAGYAEVMAFAKGAEMPVNVSRANEEGMFRMSLPPGDWELAATAPGHPQGQRKSFKVDAASTASIELPMPGTGEAVFKVKEKGGGAIPVTVAFEAVGKVAVNPVDLGRRDAGRGMERIVFSLTGNEKVLLPPGKYKAHFSRGLEYEVVTREIDVQPGKPVNLAVELEHSVDTKGFMSSDFHLHAQGSTDTDDSNEDKLRALAAGGLEIPITTDHDHIADYAPFIKALGAGKALNSVVGVELTTVRWGHFNAFPLKRDPSKPNNGALDWYGKTVPQLVKEMRGQLGAEVVQINHPRSKPGFVGGQGYLNNIGYNHKTGVPVIKNQFSTDFDGIEIMNDLKPGQMAQSRMDWFSFLNQGKRMTATGNSDSHHAFHLEAGYPRNMVRLPTDDPAKFQVKDLVAAVKKQQVTVTGGLFIYPELNGKKETLGGVFHEKTGQYRLKIRVLGPSWADLKTLELIENGETIKTWKFNTNGRITKAEVSMDLKPKRDAWYALFAFGEKDLYPVYPGARPLGYSNPFWIDVDGDGKYSPVMTVKR